MKPASTLLKKTLLMRLPSDEMLGKSKCSASL